MLDEMMASAAVAPDSTSADFTVREPRIPRQLHYANGDPVLPADVIPARPVNGANDQATRKTSHHHHHHHRRKHKDPPTSEPSTARQQQHRRKVVVGTVRFNNGMSPEEEAAHAAAVAAAVDKIDVELLPPRLVVPSERRARWSSRNTLLPVSPHQLIDGRIVRSALRLNRKRPKRDALRFTDKEITGCLEPDNPWIRRQNLTKEAVVAAYKEACDKHKVFPLQNVIYQIKSAEQLNERLEEMSFKDHSLRQADCDALEEVFRRILFYKVDLDTAIGDDSSAEALFQIFEFYEAAVHIVLSNNQNIGTCGWQACSRMLRKTECVKQMDAVNVRLTEEYMTILTRGLRYSYLVTLTFDSCHLNGRTLQLLVLALKFNLALRQLYLRNNEIQGADCTHVETLLRFNSRLSYLDLSDNLIDDEYLGRVVNGLLHQMHFGKCSRSKKGLESLVLWNNKLTKRSAPHLNAAIVGTKSLKYLSIGSNKLTDELIMDLRESLAANKTLVKLDLRSTEITCFGLAELARVIEDNDVIEVLDVRNNPISKLGLHSIIQAVELNRNVKDIFVDEKSKVKEASKIKMKYSEMVKHLQKLCESNKELAKEVDAATEDEFEDSDDNEMFGGEDLDELEQPQEELPSEYKRYMTWKI
ncbi:protein phosphatase 1 regulatory subunit 37 isoform X2 [Copidosoma floridanum]|uniref:protein phosphatase 1 regulatory subunit 37 isoform X2 n=1 Tax=Copidosoma floridanum TaxID=29053 RepID=UPI000C6F7FC4|nr:protein phosphatase 1 regulatory subunit 37 isoform X2 [Copidosoma floridanum]